MLNQSLKGSLLVALSGICYGSIGYYGTVLGQEGLSISQLLFWRFAASVLWLLLGLPFLLKNGCTREQWLILARFFVLGFVCYGIGTALYFQASLTIGTGLAMVLFFTYPLGVVAFEAVQDRQMPSWSTWVALVMISLGCLMIGYGSGFRSNVVGIVLAVLSGATYGAYLLFSKGSIGKVSPLLTTFSVCLGCGVGFFFYDLALGIPVYWPQNARTLFDVACFSGIGTVLPVLLMLEGMKYISTTRASIISVLEPVSVLVVGVIFLSESVSWIQALGSCVILSSALIVQLD